MHFLNLLRKVVHVRVGQLDDDDPPGDDCSLHVELSHLAHPLIALFLAQERHLSVNQVTGSSLLRHPLLDNFPIKSFLFMFYL